VLTVSAYFALLAVEVAALWTETALGRFLAAARAEMQLAVLVCVTAGVLLETIMDVRETARSVI